MAQIYGNEIAAKVGSTIKPDGWKLDGKVIAGDDFSEFRLTTNNGLCRSLPARFEVTGRTTQRIEGNYWVRVRITILNDGEPDTVFGGYLLTGWL